LAGQICRPFALAEFITRPQAEIKLARAAEYG
jgi:hypothetical protein